MKGWLREEVMRRVLKNTGLLGLGKGAGAVAHLATLALSARLLGPYAFGLLILVRSYAQSASGLAKFQSWQTLIRFGAVRVERGDAAGLLDLTAFTILIDAGSGLLALAAALSLAGLVGPSLGIDPDTVWLAQLYCLAIPVMTSATPTGILRIFDRFDQIAVQSVVTPVVRLFGIGLAAAAGAPLWGYVLAWLVSDLIGETYIWLIAIRELRRREFKGLRRSSPRRALRDNHGVVGFAFASNVTATLHQATTPLLTLMVGGLLGTAAAGLYRVAQVLVDAVSAPTELAMRSLFPEAARLLGRDRRHFWRLIGRALAMACLLGLVLGIVVALLGPATLVAAMGAGYADLSPVLRILAAGFVPIIGAYPLETALLALGAAGRLLFARAAAVAVTFAAGLALGARFGLPGVAIAVSAGALVAFVALVICLALQRRQRHS